MFMLGLGPRAVVHNRTDISFSVREIASDYWCQPIINRLLYILHLACILDDHTRCYGYILGNYPIKSLRAVNVA